MPVLYCCIEHERPEVGCRKLSIAHGPRLFVNIFQPARRLLEAAAGIRMNLAALQYSFTLKKLNAHC